MGITQVVRGRITRLHAAPARPLFDSPRLSPPRLYTPACSAIPKANASPSATKPHVGLLRTRASLRRRSRLPRLEGRADPALRPRPSRNLLPAFDPGRLRFLPERSPLKPISRLRSPSSVDTKPFVVAPQGVSLLRLAPMDAIFWAVVLSHSSVRFAGSQRKEGFLHGRIRRFYP